MSAEGYVTKQLQQLEIIDMAFVKMVYIVFGLLIAAVYPRVTLIDWWFFGLLFIICAIPIELHLFAQPGSLIEKAKHYLKTNTPPQQVLLFLSMFFFALMLASLVSVLVAGPWWLYLGIILILAIKPLKKSWCW